MTNNSDTYQVSGMTIDRSYISPNTGNPALEIKMPNANIKPNETETNPYKQYDYQQMAAIALPMAKKLGLKPVQHGFSNEETVVASGFKYSMLPNGLVRLALIDGASANGHKITQGDLAAAFNQVVAEAKARAGHHKTASLEIQNVSEHGAPNIAGRTDIRQLG